MLISVERRFRLPVSGLGLDDVASLAAALGAGEPGFRCDPAPLREHRRPYPVPADGARPTRRAGGGSGDGQGSGPAVAGDGHRGPTCHLVGRHPYAAGDARGGEYSRAVGAPCRRRGREVPECGHRAGRPGRVGGLVAARGHLPGENPPCPAARRHLCSLDREQTTGTARSGGRSGRRRRAAWYHRVASLDQPDEDLAGRAGTAGGRGGRPSGGCRWRLPISVGIRYLPGACRSGDDDCSRRCSI